MLCTTATAPKSVICPLSQKNKFASDIIRIHENAIHHEMKEGTVRLNVLDALNFRLIDGDTT